MRDYKPKRSNNATATRFTKSKVKLNRKYKAAKRPRNWGALFNKAGSILRFPAILCCIGLCVFGLLKVGISTIYDASFFRVAAIQVESTGKIDKATISELSGVHAGISMFDLNLKEIGTNIEKNPWISSAKVERTFPQTVTIKVTEHTPAAIINHGCLYYVASDGNIFKAIDIGEKINFPLLTGMEQKDILKNQEESRHLLADAIKLAESLQIRTLFNLQKVSEIHIDPFEGYSLMTLQGGVPIKIGFDEFESKLAHLEKIYPEIESRLPVTQYIDLNAPNRVIVKLDPIVSQTNLTKELNL